MIDWQQFRPVGLAAGEREQVPFRLVKVGADGRVFCWPEAAVVEAPLWSARQKFQRGGFRPGGWALRGLAGEAADAEGIGRHA